MLASPYFNDFQKRFALMQAKTACRMKPEHGPYVTTLGLAHYRLGQYAEALEALAKVVQSDKSPSDKSTSPVTLAFLSLTQHQLGKKTDAQANYRRLQELMKDPQWSKDEEAQAFLSEAQERIEPASDRPRPAQTKP